MIAGDMQDAPKDTQAPADPLVDAGDVRIFLSTITPGKARKLAGMLVEEGLAACVNLIPGLRSIYRWKGDICDQPETLLVIKTTAEREGALAARLGELHPYEVPECLSLPATAGLPAYLDWIAASTRAPDAG